MTSPFVVEFEFGIVDEGYWCYERMVLQMEVLQMEDCLDVLHTLCPQFDVLLLFDHSCGHNKQQCDGLNVENMAKKLCRKAELFKTYLNKRRERLPWSL